MSEQRIVAVCGKGGVGKTALTALVSRAVIDAGLGPLLLVDADPVQGLTAAIGERAARTLGEVRQQVIDTVREGEDAKQRVADRLDYLVLEALVERDGHSLFAMGRTTSKGCYCPVNTLLREAIDLVARPFPTVLIDAEAGLEQINRQVTRSVSCVVVVTDGSARSAQTLALIADAVAPTPVLAVANRCPPMEAPPLPDGVRLAGCVPEDALLRRFDAEGRSLWELDPDTPAAAAAREVARALELIP